MTFMFASPYVFCMNFDYTTTVYRIAIIVSGVSILNC